MKKFMKGKIATIVEDDDKRISEYKAKGWKEVPMEQKKAPTLEEMLLQKSIADANASDTDDGLVIPETPAPKAPIVHEEPLAPETQEEPTEPETPAAPVETVPPAPETPEVPMEHKKAPSTDKIKAKADSKKVNDAVKANLNAHKEKQLVDDGLGV